MDFKRDLGATETRCVDARPGYVCAMVAILALICSATAFGAEKSDRYISYTNEVIADVPLSIHVVRVDRANADLKFYTTLGGGDVLGMGTVTEQLNAFPADLGTPLAAINGDFYEKAKNYPGRPRDIQIRHGEVITHPAGHTSFWIDPQGNPQMTNIHSRFRVVWPNGATTPIGLNVERTNNAAVLYTAVLGPATLTTGGIEYVLEQKPGCDWLPLRPGKSYPARVGRVQTTGNTPLDKQTAVLSIGPGLAATVPALKPGAEVTVILETVPDLSGVEMAIGGGPSLVEGGKVMSWKGWIHLPHPRTAIGWNKNSIFLVEVDGRQLDVSLGMTFSQLAEQMLLLGCEQAMNLDGGGSATLWAFGSLRSSPSEGEERPAPNALVVFRKNSLPIDK